MTPAPARLLQNKSRRRGRRSTIIPDTGESTAATAKAKKTSPASPLDPVSTFTQMPMARNIAVSPKSEKLWPIR